MGRYNPKFYAVRQNAPLYWTGDGWGDDLALWVAFKTAAEAEAKARELLEAGIGLDRLHVCEANLGGIMYLKTVRRQLGRRKVARLSSMSTDTKPGPLEIPPYSFLAKQPKVPNQHRRVARAEVGGIKFEVCSNRKGNTWWIAASREGFRMSNTLRTTSPKTAEAWIAAVNSGSVRVAP